MRKIRCAAAVFAALATALALSAQDVPSKCRGCGNDKYGTAIEWTKSTAEAAKLAREQEKLVFVLHVSGYFEDPKFT